jgi:hypothetical protein
MKVAMFHIPQMQGSKTNEEFKIEYLETKKNLCILFGVHLKVVGMSFGY